VASPERLERGEYLVRHVTACGACHASRSSGSVYAEEEWEAPLSGGNTFVDGDLAVWVPNLTSDEETGLGQWSDDEIARAIRDGIRRDGSRLLPMMPFNEFQYLSDEDLRSIVVYLRSLPRVKAPTPRADNHVPFFASLLLLRFGVAHHTPAHDVAAPAEQDELQRGRYLASIAGCSYCHSRTARGGRPPGDAKFMAGGDQPFQAPELGKVWTRNLTPDIESGLGKYTPEEIKQSIRTGIRLDGKTMAPPMFQFRAHYAGMTEADLNAVVAYLRSLPPVFNQVPERELSAEMKQRVGE